MSWYRTYRPTTLSGLHLRKVREALQELFPLSAKTSPGEFPHALLFAGPKGTGKTSAARIIGMMLNDPDHKDPDLSRQILQGTSFVVQEMDAASHRGIDDVRQLREQVYLPPQQGLMSVYILDEAHMLTTEAFNALLKMLEEPPAHAVFILATTEFHKIPETIVSRCRVITFYKASPEELTDALQNILKQEKIECDPAALAEVVHAADGSFRDGVKLLETVAAGQKNLTVERVASFLRHTARQEIQAFLETIIERDEKKFIAVIQDLRARDVDQAYFHRELVLFLHHDVLASLQIVTDKPVFAQKISYYLLSQFNTLKTEANSVIPFLALELKGLELIFKAKGKDDKEGDGGVKKNEDAPRVIKATEPSMQAVARSESQPEAEPEFMPAAVLDVIPEITAVQNYTEAQELINKWDEFLLTVSQKNSSIAALLGSSKVMAGEAGKAKLEVYYQFHREQLQQPKFRALLDECVEKLLGGKVLFEFTLAEHAQKGAMLSNVSGAVQGTAQEEEHLLKLAKEILV